MRANGYGSPRSFGSFVAYHVAKLKVNGIFELGTEGGYAMSKNDVAGTIDRMVTQAGVLVRQLSGETIERLPHRRVAGQEKYAVGCTDS